jgi:hypothetical protein
MDITHTLKTVTAGALLAGGLAVSGLGHTGATGAPGSERIRPPVRARWSGIGTSATRFSSPITGWEILSILTMGKLRPSGTEITRLHRRKRSRDDTARQSLSCARSRHEQPSDFCRHVAGERCRTSRIGSGRGHRAGRPTSLVPGRPATESPTAPTWRRLGAGAGQPGLGHHGLPRLHDARQPGR